MPSSTVRRESARPPRCAHTRRRVLSRSSGNRPSHSHLCDLRSPCCAPFVCIYSRRASLEPPECAGCPTKRQGSFKITAGFFFHRSGCRFARLLQWRIHARPSILVPGTLLRFTGRRIVLFLLAAV